MSILNVNAIQPVGSGQTVTVNATDFKIGDTTLKSTGGGTLSVSSGSTAAPSISPSGDSNTGIFFPSPDTIAFVEGGAEAVRIDSSGRLGIGVNNPQSKIDIICGVGSTGIIIRPSSSTTDTNGSSTAVNNMLHMRMPYGSNAASVGNAGAKIGIVFEGRNDESFTTFGGGKRASIYGVSEDTTAGYSRTMGLAIYTSSFDASELERVRIDGSGRVTRPYQPYFYARSGSGRAGDGYTNNPYRFEDVVHNVGNHFVTSGTGAYERFVAPIAGIYCFQANPGYKQTSIDWNVRIRINGSTYAEIGRFIGSPSSHSTIGGSVTLKLNANDYVDLNNDGGAYHLNATLNYFCGYLLG